MTVPCALTVAGSDSGGGAGIQADLKTFTAFGVYGTSVLTALTAQNTQGVQGIYTIPPEMVAEQLRSVLTDIPIAAAKTGMLATAPIIHAIVAVLRERPIPTLVVDPVMVAKGGEPLLEKDAVAALIHDLLPLALLVTPNLEEAVLLAGGPISDVKGMKEAAVEIARHGPRYILVKGGHLPGEKIVDVFYNGRTFTLRKTTRVGDQPVHGTGCTLSAALCAALARGLAVPAAVRQAQEFTGEAIRTSLTVGGGRPVPNHFALPAAQE